MPSSCCCTRPSHVAEKSPLRDLTRRLSPPLDRPTSCSGKHRLSTRSDVSDCSCSSRCYDDVEGPASVEALPPVDRAASTDTMPPVQQPKVPSNGSTLFSSSASATQPRSLALLSRGRGNGAEAERVDGGSVEEVDLCGSTARKGVPQYSTSTDALPLSASRDESRGSRALSDSFAGSSSLLPQAFAMEVVKADARTSAVPRAATLHDVPHSQLPLSPPLDCCTTLPSSTSPPAPAPDPLVRRGTDCRSTSTTTADGSSSSATAPLVTLSGLTTKQNAAHNGARGPAEVAVDAPPALVVADGYSSTAPAPASPHRPLHATVALSSVAEDPSPLWRRLPRAPPAPVPVVLNENVTAGLRRSGAMLSTAFGQRGSHSATVATGVGAPYGTSPPWRCTGGSSLTESADANDAGFGEGAQSLTPRGSAQPAVDSAVFALPRCSTERPTSAGLPRNSSFSFVVGSRQTVTFSPEMPSLSAAPADTTVTTAVGGPLPTPKTSILQREPSARAGSATSIALAGSFRMSVGGYRKSTRHEEELEQSFRRASALVARMNSQRQSGADSGSRPVSQAGSSSGSGGGSGQDQVPPATARLAEPATNATESSLPSTSEAGPVQSFLASRGGRRPTSAGASSHTEDSLLLSSMFSIEYCVEAAPPATEDVALPQVIALPAAVTNGNPRRSSAVVPANASGHEVSGSPLFMGSPRGGGSASGSRRSRCDVSFVDK